MIGPLSLSWDYGSGDPGTGGHRRVTEWSEVEAVLENVKNDSGSAGLGIVDAPDIGPELVDVVADRGRFLLTLLEHTGGDSNVRSFTNMDAEPGQVEILGDYWSSSMITTDFGIVKHAFREFFDTGDVSKDLLT